MALASACGLAAPMPRPSPSPSPGGATRRLPVIRSVTSRAVRAPFNATSVAQRVYPREAYRDQGQPDTASVLDQTPGALVIRPLDEDDAVPNVPAYGLVRGGFPYETPVAIDGLPVATPSAGTLDLSLIPTYVLQQVEVEKGQGDPAGFGGGVDGAINLETALPTAQRRGMLEFEGDSTGGQFSDLAYDGTMPGGKIAFATMLSIDGEPGPLSGTSIAGAPGSDALRKALLLDARYTPTQQLQFTATVLATNLDRALAGAYGALLDSDFVSLAPSLGARQDERLRFEQLVADRDDGSDDLQVRLSGFDLGGDGYAGASSLAGAIDSERALGASWTHRAGANVYALDFDASASSDTAWNASSFAAFGQPLASGSGTARLRARFSAELHPTARTEVDVSGEGVEDGTRIGAAATRTWSSTDARVGVSETLAPQFALRASAGYGAVAPPLDALEDVAVPQISIGLPAELFAIATAVTSEERAGGGDVGAEWRLHGNTTTLSFDVYDTATNDAYVLSARRAMPGVVDALWSNAPAMRDEGAEISLVQFKPVGLGFIVQGALPRTTLSGPVSANVAGIPYAQGYGELSYKWPRGSRLSLGILYLGANNPYGRDAFETLNSNLELSVGPRSKFQLSIENLLGALTGPLPLAGAGAQQFVPGAGILPLDANVLGPVTVRVMFRQSFGQGAIYEH